MAKNLIVVVELKILRLQSFRDSNQTYGNSNNSSHNDRDAQLLHRNQRIREFIKILKVKIISCKCTMEKFCRSMWDVAFMSISQNMWFPYERRHELVTGFWEECRDELLRNAEFVAKNKESLSDDVAKFCLKLHCFNVQEFRCILTPLTM